MSIESAKAFLERIKSEAEFRKKVLEIATEKKTNGIPQNSRI